MSSHPISSVMMTSKVKLILHRRIGQSCEEHARSHANTQSDATSDVSVLSRNGIRGRRRRRSSDGQAPVRVEFAGVYPCSLPEGDERFHRPPVHGSRVESRRRDMRAYASRSLRCGANLRSIGTRPDVQLKYISNNL